MNRRDLAVFVGAAMIPARFGRAQQGERIRRIGYLTPATGSPEDELGVGQTRAVVAGLREFGWFDGRNITIDHRFSGTGRERTVATAKELVASHPDVILTIGGRATAAVLAETGTIPVVFANVGDPVASGYVASLARPGGNATGLATNDVSLGGKWLELLKEIAPQVTRVLVPVPVDGRPQRVMADAVAAAAPALGISAAIAPVRELADYEPQIADFARTPGGGLVVLSNPLIAFNRDQVHVLALRYRLPAVYSYPIHARSGGLISYGPDNVAMLRAVGRFVDRILHGAKPADLPVEQPTRYVLAVNLKTAKALGLTVPQSILARADEVIE